MRPDGTESTLSHGDRGFESRFPASWSSRSSPPRDGAPHRRPIDAIDGVAILGELHDELVEGLADDRRRGATLRGCLDVGVSRVICVFNPAIRIATGHLFTRRPSVEFVPVGTLENWSDNYSHLSILQDDAQ